MTGIRKIIYFITAAVTVLTLVQIPFAISTASIFGSPNTINTVLRDSKLYDQFVPLVTENIQKTTNDPTTKQLLADKEVQGIIEKAISPKVVEKSANSALTGIYAWLEGKTAHPEFRIDLRESKAQLTQDLSSYVEQRTTSLPVCTIEQLQTVDFQKDLLNLPCRPPGSDPKQIADQFTNDALNKIDFLKDPVVDSKELISESGQNTADIESSNLPNLYQALQNNKWYLIGLAVILTALLIFARRDRIAGLRLVAKILIGVGVFLGLLSLIQALNTFTTDGVEPVRAAAIDAVARLLDELFKTIKWFSLGYIAAGAAILLYLRRADSTPPTSSPELTLPKTETSKSA